MYDNEHILRTVDFTEKLYGKEAAQEIKDGINESCERMRLNYMKTDADFMELILKWVSPDSALKCFDAFAEISLRDDLW